MCVELGELICVTTTFSSLAGFTTSGCGCAEGYHSNSVYYLLKVTFILLAIITLSDCKKLEIEPASISSLDCTSYQISSPVVSGVSVSGNSITIPYTVGNGSKYGAVSSNSSGVTGLTADLNAGNFTIGNGVVVYSLTGTPSGSGNAVFTLSLGGQSCTLTVPVNWKSGEACSAKIS
ncbi:MAG: hypothetical protein ACKOCH_01670, partial [Bacteroidota bacterium]